MNRRHFLALLGSTAVAPVLPVPLIADAAWGGDYAYPVGLIERCRLTRWIEREMIKHMRASSVIERLSERAQSAAPIKGDFITFRRPRMFTEEAA